ncbi:MAG: glycosyltransferase family 2 protein [Lachnospiraceae bacterium]|nr:glycosyltransferase family 2 protein [Lachnospiraceae bacterium]
MKETLRIIVPCFNEEANIVDFYHEAMKNEGYFADNDVDIDICFVDDGSTDNTLAEIKKLIKKDKRVCFVSLSRNFGKEAAMYAGLELKDGEYTVFMDADLQDPPSLLPEMFEYIKQGYDTVATRRVGRKGEPMIRSFFARCFYKLMKKISKTEIVDGARDFRMMTLQVSDMIMEMPEYNRFSKGLYGWLGYKTKWLEFENVERRKGETKWSFWKLFSYSLDGITAFSTAPLRMASILGLLFCVIAFIFILIIIVRALVFGDPTAGWPSLVCIILLVSGVQLFCIGIIGEYLAKTYMEVKKRPIYVAKEIGYDHYSSSDF